MTNDLLIRSFSADLQPVRRLRSVDLRTVVWAAFALLCVSIGTCALGTRPDLAGKIALEIFAQGVASHLWRERLIGALVAAESLLLATSTEPIQKSLGQRMAWLLGTSLDERKQIVQDLKQAYDARSAFVHHGQDIEDSERQVLNRVLSACRAVVHSCLAEGRFSTREQLISHLDDLLMA